ncbi:MAG: hypothetical protein OWR62_03370 [Sulfobacillus thermotolerans]|nr:hypothetical protein [Sulfobacillus thermotolerans]
MPRKHIHSHTASVYKPADLTPLSPTSSTPPTAPPELLPSYASAHPLEPLEFLEELQRPTISPQRKWRWVHIAVIAAGLLVVGKYAAASSWHIVTTTTPAPSSDAGVKPYSMLVNYHYTPGVNPLPTVDQGLPPTTNGSGVTTYSAAMQPTVFLGAWTWQTFATLSAQTGVPITSRTWQETGLPLLWIQTPTVIENAMPLHSSPPTYIPEAFPAFNTILHASWQIVTPTTEVIVEQTAGHPGDLRVGIAWSQNGFSAGGVMNAGIQARYMIDVPRQDKWAALAAMTTITPNGPNITNAQEGQNYPDTSSIPVTPPLW